MKKRSVILLTAMLSASTIMMGSSSVLANGDHKAKSTHESNDHAQTEAVHEADDHTETETIHGTDDHAQTEAVHEADDHTVTEEAHEAGDHSAAAQQQENVLADGIYSAEFDTDSSMFHVNEANEGRGTLTVRDGVMTIHVSLVSKNVVNLFAGTAKEAQLEGAELIEPTTDTVTYSDGFSEEVYGFDIPVPALDEEFDVALIGTKEKWYDHKVSVSDPQFIEPLADDDTESDEASESTADHADGKTATDLGLTDGTYLADVTLTGGSGKATVESPAQLSVEGADVVLTLVWSSPNYDYMIVDGERYEPVNTEGNSVFEIPVTAFDTEFCVTADTTAMSVPHEIDYTLYLASDSIEEK
jgi:hypothetical protein